MENREAIKIINQYDMNFHWNDGEPIPAEQLAEAFDLAISALEQQEKVNTQSINLTHTTYPNALESLKILESAKDENGCVPMSLVRLAFRNVLEQDRKEAYEKGLSDAWDAARKIGSELRYGLEIMGFSFEPRAVGYDPGWYVVQRHSASECIAKIRQYELFRDGRISSEDAR